LRYANIKISLVFSLILFLIGTSVVPNICGNTENNEIFYINAINSYSSQRDGLLAYWSFDEGSGDTAHDYSGNNYHGTIYGASWTTGHSSYALDFDGEDDYISFDIYASDLGFNKTDDYKISAWINSVTTHSGIIYEISDDIDLIPRVYLELKDDGTLEFKVQSTESCDVTIRTNESYNNGQWNFIECIYRGDSSDPTIELYVNNELVGNDTDWLCPMNSNQFNKAKIGVRSYQETKYFNGIIDEVNIFKKSDGNLPPNAPIISGPTSGTVGEEYNYSFVAIDPEDEDIFLFIDWGDDTNTGWIGPYNSNEEVNIGHTWYANNSLP